MQNLLAALPFNITLLILGGNNLKGMRQIKVLDIFEGQGGKNFHPDGLFSTEIYGKVGEERRNRLFAFIDLKLPIFHPVIFKAVTDLKELYGGIMSGQAYATFDKQLKDFVPATPLTGETGYTFFLKHYKDIKFEERKSTEREFKIEMVNRERDESMFDKFLVMPAGLRDFTVLPSGKPEEDEINGLYRRVLSIANVIGQHSNLSDTTHMDSTRYSLQMAVNEVYAYIINLLEGKGKLIQGWWASRNIFQSTRNVITSNVQRARYLFDPKTVGPNHTVVGIYQTLRAIFPLAVNLVRQYSEKVFVGPNSPATLVNSKTLEKEQVQVSAEHYDDWMTQEGIEQLFGRFEVELLRQDPIMVDGRYFGLLYNDGKVVKFCQGVGDLPEGFDKAFLAPITYAELFYLAIYKRVKDIPALITRYPITGFGSIYPSFLYLKTTTRSKDVSVLDEQWQDTGDRALEFPVKKTPFVNSMSPAEVHLTRATADFDGDVMSCTALLSDDSISEVKALLGSRNYYVGVNGKVTFSCATDISNLIFSEMSA